MNFLMFKLVLEKAEEPEIKLPTSSGSWKKQESSRKTSISALLTMPKPLTVWITINCLPWKRDRTGSPPPGLHTSTAPAVGLSSATREVVQACQEARPTWMSTPDPSEQIRGRSGGCGDLSTCSLNSQRALPVYKAPRAVDIGTMRETTPEKSRSQL